jgi:hypothetical protein
VFMKNSDCPQCWHSNSFIGYPAFSFPGRSRSSKV